MKHEMQTLDPTGHTSVTWDPDNENEVALARSAFDDALKRGYQAFHIRGGGQQGERMRSFDPKAEKMVLVPQLVGG